MKIVKQNPSNQNVVEFLPHNFISHRDVNIAKITEFVVALDKLDPDNTTIMVAANTVNDIAATLLRCIFVWYGITPIDNELSCIYNCKVHQPVITIVATALGLTPDDAFDFCMRVLDIGVRV